MSPYPFSDAVQAVSLALLRGGEPKWGSVYVHEGEVWVTHASTGPDLWEVYRSSKEPPRAAFDVAHSFASAVGPEAAYHAARKWLTPAERRHLNPNRRK